MVQVSTTLFVAALAVAPALAAPLTLAEEFETRDVQDLEVRGRISKALGRFFGSAGSSAVDAQVNGARSFDDYLEVRGGKGNNNKKQQPQRQQPQRQSSGVSSSLGRFVGGVGAGVVENQLNSGRSFVDEDDVLEVRGKKGRKNRNRKNKNKQAETQTTNAEQSSSTSENGARDFIDLDDFLEARGGKGNNNKKQQPQRQQPQRQSSGVSSSLGRFVGGVGAGVVENQLNSGRSFDDSDFLEARGGSKNNNKKQQPQRQQPQRQSSGVSSSLGRFVGGVGAGVVENQLNSGRSFSDEELLLALRDFIDFDDLVYEAREIDELD